MTRGVLAEAPSTLKTLSSRLLEGRGGAELLGGSWGPGAPKRACAAAHPDFSGDPWAESVCARASCHFIPCSESSGAARGGVRALPL